MIGARSDGALALRRRGRRHEANPLNPRPGTAVCDCCGGPHTAQKKPPSDHEKEKPNMQAPEGAQNMRPRVQGSRYRVRAREGSRSQVY